MLNIDIILFLSIIIFLSSFFIFTYFFDIIVYFNNNLSLYPKNKYRKGFKIRIVKKV